MAIELKARGEIRPLRFDAYKPSGELGQNTQTEQTTNRVSRSIGVNERRRAILMELEALSAQQNKLVEKISPVTTDVSQTINRKGTFGDLLKKRELIKAALQKDGKKSDLIRSSLSRVGHGLSVDLTTLLQTKEEKKTERFVTQGTRTEMQRALETNNKVSVKPQVQETKAVSVSQERATQPQRAAENTTQTSGGIVVFSEFHKNNQGENTYAIDQAAQRAREVTSLEALKNVSKDSSLVDGNAIATQIVQNTDETMISGLLRHFMSIRTDGSLDTLIKFFAKLGTVRTDEARKGIRDGLKQYPAVRFGKGPKATEDQVKLVIWGSSPAKKK